MASAPAKSAIWLPPLMVLVLWEAVYLGFDFLFPAGSAKVLLAPVLFFTEFAVVFSLSLWLSAHLSGRLGLGAKEALIGLAIMFGCFVFLSLAATLATAEELLEPDQLIQTVSLFAFFTLLKLVLGAFAFGVALFLAPQGKWERFRMPGAALTLLACGAAVLAGLLVGSFFAISFDVRSSEGFSLTAANCTPGEWMYVRVFGLEFNVTVTGIETYRTRQACHAGGTSGSYDRPIRLDVYGQDNDTVCFVTNRTNDYNVSVVKESCDGDWPGYVEEED